MEVRVSRRRNTLLQKPAVPPSEPSEKNGVSRRRDASLICVVDFWSAQVGSVGLGSAGLGSALPPKVGVSCKRTGIFSKTSVSRRRDDTCIWKCAFRVDETRLYFGVF